MCIRDSLRTADVKVSPAETLDAMETLDIIGIENRVLLKNSLSMVLSKNPEEKEAFKTSFDRFFSFNKFSSENNATALDDDTHQDDGEFDPESDSPNQQSGQGGQGGGQGGGTEASGELDFEQLAAQSELGKLLLSGDRMEVMVKMAEAGRQVDVNEIVVFTQKGLYTRKIMEAMGLKGLQDEVGELQEEGGRPQMHLAGQLKSARDYLREQVRDYVEKQFFLHADESGKQLREELLKNCLLYTSPSPRDS